MIWRIYLQKARNENAAGNVDKAIEYMDKMLRFHPSVNAKVLFGYYLLQHGCIKKAREVFDGFVMNDRRVLKPEKRTKDGKIKLNRREMLAKTNYALLLWKEGNIDGAVRLLEAVHSKMHTTDLYCNLGFLYILQGDLDKALAYNKEAYDFSPEHNGICDNLGCTYFMRGDFEAAKEIYEEISAHKKQPSFPECYYNYGRVLAKTGDKKGAEEMFEKALSLPFNGFSNVKKEQVEAALQELKRK